jgi:hypothetical protein
MPRPRCPHAPHAASVRQHLRALDGPLASQRRPSDHGNPSACEPASSQVRRLWEIYLLERVWEILNGVCETFDRVWEIIDGVCELFDRVLENFDGVWEIFDRVWELYDGVWKI